MVAPNVRRRFFSWDQPFLTQAVAWLAEGRKGSAIDFSRAVAVVPTRQAGRRLREALALKAAEWGGAVFPPRVVEPDALLSLLDGTGARRATRLECMVAWAQVMAEIDLEAVRAVFPIDPPVRNFAWGVRIGQQLMKLQADLAEQGLRCGDVARIAAGWEGFVETARWEQLALLERRCDARLAEAGGIEPQALKIRTALEPQLPATIDRILILATPDPMPLALAALHQLAERRPDVAIDVAVFAPADAADAFDAWGRPVAAAWKQRPIAWTNLEQQVRLAADPAAQAAMATKLAIAYREETGRFAVGCADPEVIPALEHALAAAGVPGFNPQGRSRARESFYHLVGCLADFFGDGSFNSVESTGRCADVIGFLERRVGPSRFSAAHWMAGLDALRQWHLPATLADAQRHAPRLESDHPGLTAGLAVLADLRTEARRAGFASGGSEALRTIFADSPSASTPELAAEQRLLADAAEGWMQIVRECAAVEATAGLKPSEWWDLALRLFGEQRRIADKLPGAVELQGWFELLWEDAPHLVVAGLNDGAVPEAVPADPFLPDSLRRRLGLRTDEQRLARDTYWLQALVASRATIGRLDILVGKASSAGDPLRPSRLLFACADAELPARAAFLFRELPPASGPRTWQRAWKLVPPRVDDTAFQRLGVTALRAYLNCPFRFYLRFGLKMDAVDAGKAEMDASDFGVLCHAALQAMGEELQLRECSDPEIFRDFLFARFDEKVRERYGTELALPLIIQVESARQRLRHAARLHAQEQWAGWRIEAVERKITLQVEGITLVAKIDRIDRHRETGAVRILDYKTADMPIRPQDAHLRNLRPSDTVPDWRIWAGPDRAKIWQDLQLPLYRQALSAEFPELAACGYINLPKAVTSSALALWEPYTPDLQTSALACAQAVCRAIRAREFWPPNPEARPESDDFAPLFPHGAEPSVDPIHLR